MDERDAGSQAKHPRMHVCMHSLLSAFSHWCTGGILLGGVSACVKYVSLQSFVLLYIRVLFSIVSIVYVHVSMFSHPNWCLDAVFL